MKRSKLLFKMRTFYLFQWNGFWYYLTSLSELRSSVYFDVANTNYTQKAPWLCRSQYDLSSAGKSAIQWYQDWKISWNKSKNFQVDQSFYYPKSLFLTKIMHELNAIFFNLTKFCFKFVYKSFISENKNKK